MHVTSEDTNMEMLQAVKTAGKALALSIEAIQAAKASGDVDALFEAAKRGAKPAMIVKKASAIISHPDRYEGASERFTKETDNITKVDVKTADALAMADAVSRFNSAKRRYSAVRNVEKLIESL